MSINLAQEIIEATQILIDNAIKKTTNINGGIITAINSNGRYSVLIRGKTNILPAYPKSQCLSIGDSVNVIVPQGESSQAFIIPNSLDNLYYIKKSGDTLTGNLTIINETISTSNTSPVDIYGEGIFISDASNTPIGHIRAIALSTGYDGIEISATKNINETNYNNTIRLLIDKSGNNLIQISDPNAWKSALGIQ